MADIISWILFASGLLLTLAFLAETAAGLLPSPRPLEHRRELPRSGTIVIPAHDEAAGIGATLSALKEAIPIGFRILVVADNCSDDTAPIARSLGVETIERQDPEHRGKGYALAFARDFLRKSPPACVIVLDADCSIEPGGIEELASCVLSGDVAAQARNLLRADIRATPLTQISTFAFMIKNYIRQRGLHRLGAPAVLTGTGMAFPWRLFDRSSLGDGSLAEDLQLSIGLVLAGESPVYCDAARVWSDPAPATGALAQRARWEGGFLAAATSLALPLLARGLRQASWRKLWMGLHLLVPPLTALIFIHLAIVGALIVLHIADAAGAPLIAQTCLMLVQALLIACVWFFYGRIFVSPKALIRIPLYIIWKIPVYLDLLRRKQVEWVRTKRF